MIRLNRVRSVPPVHKNFYGPGRVAANLRLIKMKRDGELDASASDKWNPAFWKEAKDQLLAETFGKCAYCETPTDVVDYGDVEHFRPKSKYWWLAYCYENYLVSCAICNQKFKSDGFLQRAGTVQLASPVLRSNHSEARLLEMAKKLTPDPIQPGEGMSYEEFEDNLNSEWALLVNPYFEDPAEYYAYRPILETQEVHVVPAKKEYQDVVDAAQQLFGINRTELLDLRFQWYCLYMTYRHTLDDPGISANTRIMNQARMNDMRRGNMAYTGMVRYLEDQPLKDLPWRFDIQAGPALIRRGNL